jgi:hypothetical protein
MKRLLVLLLLFVSCELFSFSFDFKRISADYDVSYGILGKVGSAHATIFIEEGTYNIRVEARGVGLTNFFSRGREEVYESTGLLKEGKLLPTLFIKEKSWGDKTEKKRYFFHHDKKTVSVLKTAVEGGKVEETRTLLPYYAQNDILSVFFNLASLIGEDLQPKLLREIVAVGANRENGLLSVETPVGNVRQEIQNLLKRDDHLLIVILNQKLFSSKRGELFINVNDKGISDRVVLKDVLLYGDLVGKIKNLKIEK